jgi:spore cortex formation protein SpoVR/YcgB (stage V sporulation)
MCAWRVHSQTLDTVLDRTAAERTLQYLAQLWGYRVKLVEAERDGGRVLKEHEALPMP